MITMRWPAGRRAAWSRARWRWTGARTPARSTAGGRRTPWPSKCTPAPSSASVRRLHAARWKYPNIISIFYSQIHKFLEFLQYATNNLLKFVNKVLFINFHYTFSGNQLLMDHSCTFYFICEVFYLRQDQLLLLETKEKTNFKIELAPGYRWAADCWPSLNV